MTRGSHATRAAIVVGALVLAAAGWLARPTGNPHPAVRDRGVGLAPPIEKSKPVRVDAAPRNSREVGASPHGTVPVRSASTSGSLTRDASSTALPADAALSPGAPIPTGTLSGSSPVGTVSAWPNVRVDQTLYVPEETAIAIDPSDPNRIVAVAQGSGCYYFHSTDGGATWTEGSITDLYDLGDPTLTMDADGNAYYGYIGTWTHSGIFVARSADGGAIWQPGVPVVEHGGAAPFEDKEYPACDLTSGIYGGSLYIAWTQFDRYINPTATDSTRILFSFSRDQGTTFAPPVRVSDRGGDCLDQDNTVEGAVPAIGPEGTVYLAWAGPRGIEFDRSVDGGLTWGADKVLSNIPGGWDFAVSGIYRVNGLPVTKTDLSIGPYSGRVFVLWSDQRNGDTDVFLIHSDDRGAHWSPRVRVNGDPVGNGRDQFFPWIDVDPMTGHVYVVFYDRRATTGTNTEVWLATSTDGGGSFTEERISESPFLPNATVFFGDYIGLAAYNGRVRPFWMRLDGNQLSVWTALIEHNPTDTVPTDTVLVNGTGRLAVLPNPTRTMAHIYAGGTRLTAGGMVKVFGADGRLVRSLPTVPMPELGPLASWDLRNESGQRVPAGVYMVRSPAGAGARLVVTR
jgi:hypothetical protein